MVASYSFFLSGSGEYDRSLSRSKKNNSGHHVTQYRQDKTEDLTISH